jgi:hypothetical protein
MLYQPNTIIFINDEKHNLGLQVLTLTESFQALYDTDPRGPEDDSVRVETCNTK